MASGRGEDSDLRWADSISDASAGRSMAASLGGGPSTKYSQATPPIRARAIKEKDKIRTQALEHGLPIPASMAAAAPGLYLAGTLMTWPTRTTSTVRLLRALMVAMEVLWSRAIFQRESPDCTV
jgi:hypothetical protein